MNAILRPQQQTLIDALDRDLVGGQSAVQAIRLRPYQHAAREAMFDYWRNGGGNPLVEMATGTGKSLAIAALIRRLYEGNPARRFLILTHVRELIEQDAKALLALWPDAPIGICSAGLGERNREASILFGGIQSVHREPEALGQRNLVIIDEAHLIPQAGDGMYLTTLARLRGLYPPMRIAGFTATPFRLDSGRLDEGEDRLFDRMVYRYGIKEAINDGWLAPLIAKATASEIDTRDVHRRGGEFIAAELERAADRDDIVNAAADEIVERGASRKSWLCFCAGRVHAEHIRDALRRRGVFAKTVTGETPTRERTEIFERFRAGDIRCLTGVNVFSVGFDAPAIDMIAMLRPTLSPGMYIQQVGRGARKADGKLNCLVLDFAGNVRRHGPVDDPVVRTSESHGKNPDHREGEGTVKVKACPDCRTYVAATVETCPECGHHWPVRRRSVAHASTADNLEILSSGSPVQLTVAEIALSEHLKPDGERPTLKIEYRTAAHGPFFEWLAFDHEGAARHIARATWRELGGQLPAPNTVRQALNRRAELAGQQLQITVRRDGRYWQVIKRDSRKLAVPA